jgi:hypothetical protein
MADKFNLFEPVKKEAAEPEFATVLRHAIAKNIATRLIKRVDQFGDLYDYRVAGDDRSAFFKIRDEAVALITRATVAPILKQYFGAAYGGKQSLKTFAPRPDPYGPDDRDIVSPGIAGVPLDQDDSNYDPRLAMQQRPRHGKLDGANIFSRTKRGGPVIDGVRQPVRRSKRTRGIL